MHRIPSPAVLLLAAVLAPTCAQEDAPAADFIISHDSVTPVANTGPPARARLDLVAGWRHLLRTHERLPHRGYPERRRRHRPLPAEPVGDDEWDDGNREFEEWRAENRSASCDPSGPTRPATRPILRGLYIAPDGRLWVEVERASGNLWEVALHLSWWVVSAGS